MALVVVCKIVPARKAFSRLLTLLLCHIRSSSLCHKTLNKKVILKSRPVSMASEELEWYEIRDRLLGHHSRVAQDLRAALQLATFCRHPDAQWLAQIFAGKNVRTVEEARAVFLAQGDDARALCFAALLSGSHSDEPRLLRAAELGYAFAQVSLAWSGKTASFAWAWPSRAAR